jgi:F0F1-type ATP synthase gamma subunit
MESFRPYAAKFAEVLGSLAENAGEEASPLLVPRENPKKVNIVLTTSDRGLCGGFNINLIRIRPRPCFKKRPIRAWRSASPVSAKKVGTGP